MPFQTQCLSPIPDHPSPCLVHRRQRPRIIRSRRRIQADDQRIPEAPPHKVPPSTAAINPKLILPVIPRIPRIKHQEGPGHSACSRIIIESVPHLPHGQFVLLVLIVEAHCPSCRSPGCPRPATARVRNLAPRLCVVGPVAIMSPLPASDTAKHPTPRHRAAAVSGCIESRLIPCLKLEPLRRPHPAHGRWRWEFEGRGRGPRSHAPAVAAILVGFDEVGQESGWRLKWWETVSYGAVGKASFDGDMSCWTWVRLHCMVNEMDYVVVNCC